MTKSRKERRFYVIYSEPNFNRLGQIVYGTNKKTVAAEFEYWYNRGHYKTIIEIQEFDT